MEYKIIVYNILYTMSNSNTEQLLSEYNFYLNEMDTLAKWETLNRIE